jgi:hypothetical protein
MESSDRRALQLDGTMAEAHLGSKKQALADLEGLEEQVKSDGPVKEMTKHLAIAEISINVGLAQKAHDEAAKAATHFSSMGQLDSALRSSCLAASASKMLNNGSEFNTYSAIVVDIISRIQHTWSPQDSQTYLSRPDISMLLRDIPAAAHYDRRSP